MNVLVTNSNNNMSALSLPEDEERSILLEEETKSSFDLKAAVMDRRGSLTTAELSFLKELSETAVDTEQLSLVDKSLSNSALFFDSFNGSSNSTNHLSAASLGSVRRVKKVETRRATKESRMLKQAALKVMAMNKLSSLGREMPFHLDASNHTLSSRRGSDASNPFMIAFSSRRGSAGSQVSALNSRRGSAGSQVSPLNSRRGSVGSQIPSNSRRGSALSIGSVSSSKKGSFVMTQRSSTASTIRAIMEDLSFDSDSDDEDEEEKKEEKKEEDYAVPLKDEDYVVPLKEPQNRRDLMTRSASINLYGGEGFEIGEESLFDKYDGHYDPWEVLTDSHGRPLDFQILGTDGSDLDASPHVLSPPQMHSLQEHLPYSKRGESFWLKYSLVRDGADKTSFLTHLRSDEYTVMAMETVDGEVFGAFTAAPWNIQHGYFGTAESFVWRLKQPRDDEDDCNRNLSFHDRDSKERDIDVFKYSFGNTVAQICTHDRVAVGGGTVSFPKMVADGTEVQPNQFGFAISFDGQSMLEATSSPCVTFNSPGLSKFHQDGSRFELLNLEVWSLTPCITIEEAQRMACQKLFLKENRTALKRAVTV